LRVTRTYALSSAGVSACITSASARAVNVIR
jgi:hypothetical protein